MVNLPAYLAAGLPIEGILLTEALEQIPDIFMTLGNVTADMSVAVILSTSRASGVVDDLERRCRGKVEVSPP
jgi:Na+/H+-dicarboxylate symporter